VSADSLAAHGKFARNHGLPFPLLSDEGRQTCRAYGVWKKKSMYGKSYEGIERSTFVIDRDGRLAAVFRKVSVDGHHREVLEAVSQLG
jgi:peroxiredoxin Q/BCP